MDNKLMPVVHNGKLTNIWSGLFDNVPSRSNTAEVTLILGSQIALRYSSHEDTDIQLFETAEECLKAIKEWIDQLNDMAWKDGLTRLLNEVTIVVDDRINLTD